MSKLGKLAILFGRWCSKGYHLCILQGDLTVWAAILPGVKSIVFGMLNAPECQRFELTMQLRSTQRIADVDRKLEGGSFVNNAPFLVEGE